MSNPVSDNYVQLVPGFIVFDNILPELVHVLNISATAELLVLYDQHFGMILQLVTIFWTIFRWRSDVWLEETIHFTAPPYPFWANVLGIVCCLHARQTAWSGRKEHFRGCLNWIGRIVSSFTNFFIESLKRYLQAAIPQFDARHFRRFVVLSKDTLSLKCEDCLSADLFWYL